MAMDVLCVGEMLVDFLPGEYEGAYIRKAGGAPANVAIAVARNGLKAGMCCAVGDDDFGVFLQNTLRDNNVQCVKEERIKDAFTTMAFVSLTPEGERSFSFARKPGADMFLSPADIDAAEIEDVTILHAGSCSLSSGFSFAPSSAPTVPIAPTVSTAPIATRYALSHAHELGKIVSFDMNYRPLLWNGDKKAALSSVIDVLEYVDLLKVSAEEAEMLGGWGAIGVLMAEKNISVVVETLGENGANCCRNGEIFHVDAKKTTCVDSTGAGDAFWGFFISQLLLDGVKKPAQIDREKLLRAMEIGCTAGSFCVRKKGAIEALPWREDIIREEIK